MNCLSAWWHTVTPACRTYCLQACQPVYMVRRMIIVVANTKGGVGKSTIAVLLSTWLHKQGHSVMLADCDTQHSSSVWAKEAVPDLSAVQLSTAHHLLDRR